LIEIRNWTSSIFECIRIKPNHIGLPPGIPDQLPHTITFKDLGKGKTEITIVESGYTNAQVVEMSKSGMASVLDKLTAEVEKQDAMDGLSFP